MNLKYDKEYVKKYYDQEASDYIKMYQSDYNKYPANAIRLNIIVNRLIENKTNTLLDIGCGTCGPLIRFLKEGINCKGIDFSNDMIKVGKENLSKEGLDPDLITLADLENDPLPTETFDAAIALGVFPHVENEKDSLLRMKKKLNKNGKVFIELDNEIFSAFTLNKYSLDFFLNKLIDLDTLPENLKTEVIQFFELKFSANNMPVDEKGKISFLNILRKFHNPLTIEKDLFEPCGFKVDKIHFYHFHALPPIFEDKFPELFKKLSLNMENSDDWRGYLMASAYVVEATKND